jgi:hypothetical protein
MSGLMQCSNFLDHLIGSAEGVDFAGLERRAGP